MKRFIKAYLVGLIPLSGFGLFIWITIGDPQPPEWLYNIFYYGAWTVLGALVLWLPYIIGSEIIGHDD